MFVDLHSTILLIWFWRNAQWHIGKTGAWHCWLLRSRFACGRLGVRIPVTTNLIYTDNTRHQVSGSLEMTLKTKAPVTVGVSS